MTRIAFLGLGAMGSRMAASLLDAGFDLTVWNRDPTKADALVAKGARLAETPRTAADGADIVMAMVRDDDASRAVWLDAESGALAGLSAGAIAIESSTLTPGWVNELAQAAAERGVRYLDAPVAGSRPQAEAKRLIYLVGGEAATLAAAEPALKAIGAVVQHAGPVGTGTTMKHAINALLGVQIAALAELLGMIAKRGVDAARAVEIISAAPVASPAAIVAAQTMVAGAYSPLFPVELVAKDFGYIAAGAAQVGARTPMVDAASRVFQQAINAGLGAEQLSAVRKLY